MAEFYFESDDGLKPLMGLTIGVIGYGNQGRAHALNLRDSGLNVRAATRSASPARQQAVKDGFPAYSIEEAAANCPVLAVMLPDEVIPGVYASSIEPYLEAQTVFVFAHGFVVHHKTVRLPDDADVLLVAPTGPGRQLRSLYESGQGLPGLLAVEQDASGLAWPRTLAYASAIGCLRAGCLKTTFKEETVIDLYCEQAVLCGGMPELIKASFQVLVAQGYQPELAYISCLKEVKLIADLLFERGLDGMRAAISNTAKFGSAIAGPQLINANTTLRLKQLLQNIESGRFASQFLAEASQASPATRELLLNEQHSRLSQTGKQLQEVLKF